MELKFIWVQEYRIIKNTGFNFNHSGPHQFSFNNGQLQLLQKPEVLINFGSNITGVTAIAGENGSGKSSLCEIALLTTATRVNGAFGYDIEFHGVVCYGEHIFYHEDTLINNIPELESAGYILTLFKDSPFEKMDEGWIDSFHRGGFIYYSNVLDLRSDFKALNLSNISSQNFIREDYKYSTSYPSDNPYTYEFPEHYLDKDQHDPIHIYYLGQGYRFTKFYVNFPSIIPFNKPKDFTIKSAYSGNNRWLSLHTIEDYETKSQYSTLESNILGVVSEKFLSKNDANLELEVNTTNFQAAIHQLYKLNLLKASGVLANKIPALETVLEFLYENKVSKGLFDNPTLITKLIKVHRKILSACIIPDGNYKPFSMQGYYSKMSDWRFKLLERIFLPSSNGNIKLLKEFMDLEEKTLSSNNNFRRITNYSISPELSSGESSYMSLFSRLHDVIQRYNNEDQRKNNLILFIDEAEVGLHPQWKKFLFKWLIDFLNEHTSGYSFQLILTTHSPYLLSDIPSTNVLLLKKGESGKTEIVPPDNFKSFGSNVHELLATNFFMKDGFMGEFAKAKIEELVEYYEGNNQVYTEESSAQLISLIGDDVIAMRLADMHNEKFGTTNNLDNEQYEAWLIHELERIKLPK